MKNIYCIVGPSGSGKTTLVEALKKEYGYKVIESYTTRPSRFEDETGHIFVSSDEFKKLNDVYAYNQYDGYEYGITAAQLEENDLYVVEPSGVEDLLKRYRGSKGIKVIGLNPDVEVLIERMKLRGDSDEKIIKRLIEDADTFKNLYNIADVMFTADLTVDALCEALHSHIENFEYWAKHDYTLLDERGEEVHTFYNRFYTAEDVLTHYHNVNPDVSTDGWSVRDDTALAVAGYVKDIHKCRPSFKTSMIRVDESNAGRSSDGYLAVRFYYKDKTYFYREPLNDDAWIQEYVRPVDKRTVEEVLESKLEGLYNRMRYIDRELGGEYRDLSKTSIAELKNKRNQINAGICFIKNAIKVVNKEKNKDNDVRLLDDVIKDAKDKSNIKKPVFCENIDICY